MSATSAPLRCAYCHAPFAGPARSCDGCDTALHEDCWALAGSCPTLGCELAHASPRPERAKVGRRILGASLVLASFLVVALPLVVLVVGVLRGPDPGSDEPRHPALLASFDGRASHPRDLAFTPDGRLLVARCDLGLRAWSIADGALLGQVNGPHRSEPGIAISPRGDLAAIGMELRALPDLRLVGLLPAPALTFSPDGAQVATLTSAGVVVLVAQNDGRELKRLEAPARASSTRSSGFAAPPGRGRFSAGGDLLAVAVRDRLLVWRLTDGSLQHDLDGHELPGELWFSVSGRQLVSVGDGWASDPSGPSTLACWRADEERPVSARARFDAPARGWARMTIGSDARTVALGGDHGLRWTDLSGRACSSLPAGSVTAIAISPDGRLLASGNTDNHVYVWKSAMPDEEEAMPADTARSRKDG